MKLALVPLAVALAVPMFGAWGQHVIAPAIPVESQSTRFIRAVHASLELLRQRAPDDFEFARTHVGWITEVVRWEDVGIAVARDPPVVRLRRQEVMGSATWLASVIVHEACHRHQYLQAVERHGTKFPPNYEFSGRIAELECLKRQGEVLERLGAPVREIAHVRKADGRHYLRDAHGNYYKSPPGRVWWDPSASDPREGAAKK